jgi:hypothetical protein
LWPKTADCEIHLLYTSFGIIVLDPASRDIRVYSSNYFQRFPFSFLGCLTSVELHDGTRYKVSALYSCNPSERFYLAMFDEGDGGNLWFHRANPMELFVFAVETAIFFKIIIFIYFQFCHVMKEQI